MDLWRVSWAVAVAASASLGGSPLALGGEEEGGNLGAEEAAVVNDVEETFEIGGSCAALAYVSADQLRVYLGAGYADDFHAFCFPEEPFECGDYTSFVRGVGKLATGDDGYHCSLQLAN